MFELHTLDGEQNKNSIIKIDVYFNGSNVTRNFNLKNGYLPENVGEKLQEIVDLLIDNPKF